MRSQHDILLERLAADGLDALTPEQIERLAAAAESDPLVAERLAASPAPGAAAWYAPVPQPTAAEWERVWARINAAGQSDDASTPLAAESPRAVSLWWRIAPLLSAAAALLLALLWWDSPRGGDGGAIQLSSHTEIQALETYDDGTVFITDAGDGSGAIVIWSVDSDAGA